MIVGIDEVGRGPWAGPLVTGAVVLGTEIEGLTDSKKLSAKRRSELAEEIHAKALGVGLGWVEATEIDTLGLGSALEVACRRAVETLELAYPGAYSEIIIDGTINFLKNTGKGAYVTTMKKADLLIPSVSAASIVAKVARDTYMEEQDILYPLYGFKSHVGYGTALHRAAIEKYGVTPLHRLSFAPLAKYRDEAINSGSDLKQAVTVSTTRAIGDASESAATEELRRQGHEIIERNWKTKYCEIDIVSRKGDTMYFSEVKHRRNAHSGDGLAAITSKKLHQMSFAAKLYSEYKKLSDVNLRLIVIGTSGDVPVVETLLELE